MKLSFCSQPLLGNNATQDSRLLTDNSDLESEKLIKTLSEWVTDWLIDKPTVKLLLAVASTVSLSSILLSDDYGSLQTTFTLLTNKSKSKPKSKLLYDWQFTADQYVLVWGFLELTTQRHFFYRTLAAIVFIWRPLWREDEFVSYE
jgi:hypothetical protein